MLVGWDGIWSQHVPDAQAASAAAGSMHAATGHATALCRVHFAGREPRGVRISIQPWQLVPLAGAAWPATVSALAPSRMLPLLPLPPTQAAARQQKFESSAVGRAAYNSVKEVKDLRKAGGGNDGQPTASDWQN